MVFFNVIHYSSALLSFFISLSLFWCDNLGFDFIEVVSGGQGLKFSAATFFHYMVVRDQSFG